MLATFNTNDWYNTSLVTKALELPRPSGIISTGYHISTDNSMYFGTSKNKSKSIKRVKSIKKITKTKKSSKINKSRKSNKSNKSHKSHKSNKSHKSHKINKKK